MARRRSPALTDAEAKVMSVIWQRQTATVGDVVTALHKGRGATYSTVQTILRILETKGYVSHEKVARAFVYRPVVDEHQARRRALKIGRASCRERVSIVGVHCVFERE